MAVAAAEKSVEKEERPKKKKELEAKAQKFREDLTKVWEALSEAKLKKSMAAEGFSCFTRIS